VRSPRITYVITDLKTGGVPLHLLRLSVAIRERGFDPRVISLAPPGPVTQQLADAGIETTDCGATGVGDLAAIWRLARHLRNTRPDLVHSFLFHANAACRLAVPLAGRSLARLICEIQTVEVERRWHLTVEGMLHRLGACVVGNSPAVVSHLQRCAHIAPSRLRCVPGGVDVEQIRAAAPADRQALGIPDTLRIVMWVGRMDPVKGLDELIDAFAVVAKSIDARLLLVGAGEYAGAVRRRIETHGLQERVMLLGRRDDVPSLLKIADVFVFPSRTEGMPNALLEAMAAGRAIVTTDVPGCRDVIVHQENGLLVPSQDAIALSEAIRRLLSDQALSSRLAHSAENSAAHYGFDRTVDRYEALYRHLVN